MLGATANNLTLNNNECHEHPFLSTSSTYSCALCQAVFQDGREQRMHMKSTPHLDNLQRRRNSLQPDHVGPCDKQDIQRIPRNDESPYKGCRRKVSPGRKPSAYRSTVEERTETSPYACLICNQNYGTDSVDVSAVIRHMEIAHGLFIPEQDLIIDLQCFIKYLATTIREWHECLYCGTTRSSTESIQSHMRDKAHFRLNFEREPELRDFWETADGSDGDGEHDDSRAAKVHRTIPFSDEEEVHLPSGKVINSKTTSNRKHRDATTTRQSATLTTQAQSRSSPPSTDLPREQALEQAHIPSRRKAARNEELSLAGIPLQTRQALILAEKHAQRSQAAAQRAKEWVNAKGANTQKFDQMDTTKIGKRGKQTHKLLPR